MKHDGTAELLAYWNRIREKRPAPERTEIEPAAIRRRLPDIFILESPENAETRFRLAGTRLCTIHGGELRNSSFLSLWSEEDRAAIDQLLHTVFESKAAAVIDHEAKSLSGRRSTFETLLLPLAGAASEARLIGSMIALDPAYWLGADRIVESSVLSISLLDPKRAQLQAETPAVAVASGSSLRSVSRAYETQCFFDASGPRQIRHLTVLDGGKI
ncbi:PAS domain-containing protein [Phyllobacterium phragmitis]|nr:PAS domain-containing protein [Phyllobacterium phragmitis]